MANKIIIGARKSPLAQIQAQQAAKVLNAQKAFEFVFVGFTTSGDKIQDKHLRDMGGKELFVREVEEALLAKEIELAVHSLKDMPAEQPKGITIAAILPRQSPLDALVSALGYKTLADLPKGARVGTASPRRTAQIKHFRPDLVPVLLRGNVDSRLEKIKAGELDAAVLALAGLERLGKADFATALSSEVMLPAAGQGAICVQCRLDDKEMLSLCSQSNDPPTQALVAAERSFSSAFGASCHTPVAALASWSGGGTTQKMTLIVELLSPDGETSFKQSFESGNPLDPIALGEKAAQTIKAQAGEDFLAAIQNL